MTNHECRLFMQSLLLLCARLTECEINQALDILEGAIKYFSSLLHFCSFLQLGKIVQLLVTSFISVFLFCAVCLVCIILLCLAAIYFYSNKEYGHAAPYSVISAVIVTFCFFVVFYLVLVYPRQVIVYYCLRKMM